MLLQINTILKKARSIKSSKSTVQESLQSRSCQFQVDYIQVQSQFQDRHDEHDPIYNVVQQLEGQHAL